MPWRFSGVEDGVPEFEAIAPWQPPRLLLRAIEGLEDGLEAALDALEQDQEFLLRGEVFTDDLLSTWIEYKRKNEVDAMRLRPHPYEFCLYYDC